MVMLKRYNRGTFGFIRRPLSWIFGSTLLAGGFAIAAEIPSQPVQTGSLTLPIRTFTKVDDPKAKDPKKPEWIKWSPKGHY